MKRVPQNSDVAKFQNDILHRHLGTIDWRTITFHVNVVVFLSLLFADHCTCILILWLWQGLWCRETWQLLQKAYSFQRLEFNPIFETSLLITPSFLTGVSIRFCSFEGANENVWHVLVRATTGTINYDVTLIFISFYYCFFLACWSHFHFFWSFSLLFSYKGSSTQLSCRHCWVTIKYRLHYWSWFSSTWGKDAVNLFTL